MGTNDGDEWKLEDLEEKFSSADEWKVVQGRWMGSLIVFLVGLLVRKLLGIGNIKVMYNMTNIYTNAYFMKQSWQITLW